MHLSFISSLVEAFNGITKLTNVIVGGLIIVLVVVIIGLVVIIRKLQTGTM